MMRHQIFRILQRRW